MPRVSPDGWTVQVTHPTSGRTIRPEVLDKPRFIPSLTTLPKVRLPVRRAPEWLRQEFDDSPEMDIWLDGQKLPIDELQRVEDEQGQTVLVGIGGVELRDRVAVEKDNVRAEDAARDLIQNETSYAPDVDNTDRPLDEDVVFQSASTTTEFEDVIVDVPDTEPIVATNDGLELAQTCWVAEVTQPTTINRSDFSDGKGGSIVADGVTMGAQSVTIDYNLPVDNIITFVRGEEQNGDVFLDPVIDNTSYSGTTVEDTLGWSSSTLSGNGVVSGSTVLEFESDTLNNGEADVDVVAFADNRFSYTLDNSVHQADGYLDGPELYPDAASIAIPAGKTSFNIAAAVLDTIIDDTSGSQALELSQDGGANYKPASPDKDNTESVDVSFSSVGNELQSRITLQRISPNGARSQTPRFGYDTQRITEWDLTADLQFDSLLLDFSRDDDLETILNDIAGDEFIWSYRIDGGQPTISWTQPGDRVATSDPEIEDISVEKQVETFGKITIKGSDRQVTGEEITADVGTAVSLANDFITPGSEVVRDDGGTNYDRADDYEMDYSAGEITVLSDGSISDGLALTVDYRHQISGSFTSDNAASPPRELVQTIPDVVSTREAEVLASLIADINPGLSTPSYGGSIVIPDVDATFDPLEALPLSEFRDIPDIATPLEPAGEVEVTPRGIRFRLGGPDTIEQSLSDIADQVQSVSRRF